jgi:glycosyltransferase involved in cell wall biosynthesis
MSNSTDPILSIIVVIFNMDREFPRTLTSLSSEYQNISKEKYEVIVVDNGSDTRQDEEVVSQFGDNFRYYYIENASPSPAPAVNFGVSKAKGEMVGIMVDGARILSPGIIKYVLMANKVYAKPFVSTLGWHLGEEPQQKAIKKGYDEKVEDELLRTINWPEDGYKLFEISALAPSSNVGWFLPIFESNCFFLSRKMFKQLRGFEEAFDEPGGGLVNPDFYSRACEIEDLDLVVLLGEGTFHQFHNGTATGSNQIEASRIKRREKYEKIRGKKKVERINKDPDYWGRIPREAIPFLKLSSDKKWNRYKKSRTE